MLQKSTSLREVDFGTSREVYNADTNPDAYLKVAAPTL